MIQNQFTEIIQLIKQSRSNAIKAVNAELINLYWNVGYYIHLQVANANWGEKTVDELAAFIQNNHPELKGFNRRGIYRMKQFFETYYRTTIVSPVKTQIQLTDNQELAIVSSTRTQLDIYDIRNSILVKLSWTHHRTIFSRCKIEEERDFYLRICIKENYSVKELDRQISAGLFERTKLGNSNLPNQMREINSDITNSFKDNYVFEFLNLPEQHNEFDIQKGLIKQMKAFILELGKDFLFIDEESLASHLN